jgi:hypothetical protein
MPRRRIKVKFIEPTDDLVNAWNFTVFAFGQLSADNAKARRRGLNIRLATLPDGVTKETNLFRFHVAEFSSDRHRETTSPTYIPSEEYVCELMDKFFSRSSD